MSKNNPNQPHPKNPAFLGTALTLAFKSDRYSNGWRSIYAPDETVAAWDLGADIDETNLFAVESPTVEGCFSYAYIEPVARKQSKVLGSRACYAPRGYRVRVTFVNPEVTKELGESFEAWVLDELDPASR